MGFFRKLKGFSKGVPSTRKCQCGKRATRTKRGKDGTELYLCYDCYAVLCLAMMIDRNIFGKQLFDSAVSARQTGRFQEALFSFAFIAEKIEDLIHDYHAKMISSSEAEKASAFSLILDFLDTYTYVHQQAGCCAYEAGQLALRRFESAIDIIAIEHLLKAVRNKPPYRYLTSLQKLKPKPTMSKDDIPLVDIPRPSNVLNACEMLPIIDFEKLGIELSSGRADEGIMIANVVRYHDDLASFALCYTVLGKSLLNLGTYPIQSFFASSENQAARRDLLIMRLMPRVFLFAAEMFGLARDCIEELPIEEETFKAGIAYGTTFFDEGMCYNRLKMFSEAKDRFTKALNIYENKEKWPSPKNAELGIADCYLYRGECEIALGNKEEAKKNLDKCLKISMKLGVNENVEKAKALLRKVEMGSYVA